MLSVHQVGHVSIIAVWNTDQYIIIQTDHTGSLLFMLKAY